MKRRTFTILAGGGVLAVPSAVRAQQPSPVIGFLHSGSAAQNANRVAGFLKGLSDGGFAEGRNLVVEYRWADGQNDRLPALAADLLQRQVAVIATLSSQPATAAARAATSTVPIVFTWPGDPVEDGLAASLARPGGNTTGISTLNVELVPKRIGLLRELAPRTATVAVLLNPNDPSTARTTRELQRLSGTLGVGLQLLQAGNDGEIDAAIATLAGKGDVALLVNADPFFFTRRARLAEQAARHRVPAIYYDREFAVSGGLMSYGTDLPRAWGQAGGYVARILKGDKPGELPVAQPTKFELVVNAKAARDLGLLVPLGLLATADEVIE
jgi:putative ABC transport system substrate-binding protein